MRPFLCLALLALAPASAVAQPVPAPVAAPAFVPTRFSVEVVGSGPDVILIPGLTSSRSVWRAAIAATPGYRYHLIQVAGFAGAPAGGNARGEVVAPLAEEIARYIRANRLDRPALVGHSMGGTIALMIASRHPDLAGKAMVVDMLPQPAALVGGSAAGLRGLADTLQGLAATQAGRDMIDSAIGLFGGEAARTGADRPYRRSAPDPRAADRGLCLRRPGALPWPRSRLRRGLCRRSGGASGPDRRQRPFDHGRSAGPVRRGAPRLSRALRR
jgi:N-formylmaleamate deformylase